MARAKRRVFEATGPFVARVAFSFNSELYLAGEVFPQCGIEFRKLRQLYDCRRINFSEDAGVLAEAKPVVFDWRTLDEQGLLDYAFEQTGTRFRKPERAISALEEYVQ